MNVWVWWAHDGDELGLVASLDPQPNVEPFVIEVPRSRGALEARRSAVVAHRKRLADGADPLEMPLWIWADDLDEAADVTVASERNGKHPSVGLDLPTDPWSLDHLHSALDQALRRTPAPAAKTAATKTYAPKPKAVRGRKSPRTGRSAAATSAKVKARLVGASRPFGSLAPSHFHVVRGGAPGLGK